MTRARLVGVLLAVLGLAGCCYPTRTTPPPTTSGGLTCFIPEGCPIRHRYIEPAPHEAPTTTTAEATP
jgi:hypothetical protein